jgi:hypothetical protein
MPTKETATRPGILELQAAVEKLSALKAEEEQITASIAQEVVVGNDVGPLQARRVAVRASIETAEEAVKALRPFAAAEEQALLRSDLDAAHKVRDENRRKAAEAQTLGDDLVRQADAAYDQVQFWKYKAADRVFTLTEQLRRHVETWGDLSGGEAK